MVVKIYISGISGNKEVKKKQQRVQMILDSKSISYEAIDITEPGREKEKETMQQKAKPREVLGKHPLPPQIFNEDDYCGDYEDFDAANEVDELEAFLHLPIPSKLITPANDTLNGSQDEQNSRNGAKTTEVNGDVILTSLSADGEVNGQDKPDDEESEDVDDNQDTTADNEISPPTAESQEAEEHKVEEESAQEHELEPQENDEEDAEREKAESAADAEIDEVTGAVTTEIVVEPDVPKSEDKVLPSESHEASVTGVVSDRTDDLDKNICYNLVTEEKSHGESDQEGKEDDKVGEVLEVQKAETNRNEPSALNNLKKEEEPFGEEVPGGQESGEGIIPSAETEVSKLANEEGERNRANNDKVNVVLESGSVVLLSTHPDSHLVEESKTKEGDTSKESCRITEKENTSTDTEGTKADDIVVEQSKECEAKRVKETTPIATDTVSEADTTASNKSLTVSAADTTASESEEIRPKLVKDDTPIATDTADTTVFNKFEESGSKISEVPEEQSVITPVQDQIIEPFLIDIAKVTSIEEQKKVSEAGEVLLFPSDAVSEKQEEISPISETANKVVVKSTDEITSGIKGVEENGNVDKNIVLLEGTAGILPEQPDKNSGENTNLVTSKTIHEGAAQEGPTTSEEEIVRPLVRRDTQKQIKRPSLPLVKPSLLRENSITSIAEEAIDWKDVPGSKSPVATSNLEKNPRDIEVSETPTTDSICSHKNLEERIDTEEKLTKDQGAELREVIAKPGEPVQLPLQSAPPENLDLPRKAQSTETILEKVDKLPESSEGVTVKNLAGKSAQSESCDVFIAPGFELALSKVASTDDPSIKIPKPSAELPNLEKVIEPTSSIATGEVVGIESIMADNSPKMSKELDAGSNEPGKIAANEEQNSAPIHGDGVLTSDLLFDRYQPFNVDKIAYTPQLVTKINHDRNAPKEGKGVVLPCWDRRPSEVDLVKQVRELLDERDDAILSCRARLRAGRSPGRDPHFHFLAQMNKLLSEVDNAKEVVSYQVVPPPRPPPKEPTPPPEPPVNAFLQEVLRALNAPYTPKPKPAPEKPVNYFLEQVKELMSSESMSGDGQAFYFTKERGPADDSDFVHKVRIVLDERETALGMEKPAKKVDHSEFLGDVLLLLNDEPITKDMPEDIQQMDDIIVPVPQLPKTPKSMEKTPEKSVPPPEPKEKTPEKSVPPPEPKEKTPEKPVPPPEPKEKTSEKVVPPKEKTPEVPKSKPVKKSEEPVLPKPLEVAEIFINDKTFPVVAPVTTRNYKMFISSLGTEERELSTSELEAITITVIDDTGKKCDVASIVISPTKVK